MRGTDEHSGSLFSYVDLEARVPADHPLRPIRALVDEALLVLSPDFERLYSKTGRPSIAPEKLLRALLLQAFFTIRSERQLMEQLDYNLLFRWFVGLSMDERVWDATVYSKNRDRLVAGDVAARFLQAVLQGERVRRLLSEEHFSVDGTLIGAWASMKSFRPKEGGDDDAPGIGGRNTERDFRGERRSNATHASSTDADARLYRKGQGQSSRLCFMGHLLMENGNALIVDAELTEASGTAERDAALAHGGASGERAADHARRRQGLRRGRLRGHLAQPHRYPSHRRRRPRDQDRQAAKDPDRPAHHPACGLRREPAAAQAHRGGLRLDQDHRRAGQDPASRARPVGWMFTLTAAAYNLVRLPKLMPRPRPDAYLPRNTPLAPPRAGCEPQTVPPTTRINRPNPPKQPQMARSSAAC